MSARMEMADIWIAGDSVLVAPLAGIGGSFRESGPFERVPRREAEVLAALERQLANSQISEAGLAVTPIPAKQTAAAKARALARAARGNARLFQVFRGPDAFKVTEYRRDPSGPGFIGGEPKEVDSTTELLALLELGARNEGDPT